MAHWLILFLVVVVHSRTELCQTHWPPYSWPRVKTYTDAIAGERMPTPRGKPPCVLVSA